VREARIASPHPTTWRRVLRAWVNLKHAVADAGLDLSSLTRDLLVGRTP
jgi:hypothetical protein